MKYVGVLKSKKIRCTRQDGITKDYVAEEAVYEYSKKTFKKGDNVAGEFNKKGILEKLSLYKKKTSGGGNQAGYNKNSYSTANLDKQSILKSASQALSGIEGVTAQNFESIYKKLIELNLSVIQDIKPEQSKNSPDDDILEDNNIEQLAEEELEE